MASVYTILEDGTTRSMERIHCKSEDEELQRILENNPDLLPGDQINPNDPRRWLLVQREMPVPDPNTGVDRWYLDFFFVDQDATPTFVECKLFKNTEARREVVGQLIEYAANGHYYWTKEIIRDFAEKTAAQKGGLEAAFRTLQPNSDESIDVFFERIQKNLREGRVRLVFFLEKASMELRSIVDFLNKQMERSEVLLVEARQYLLGEIKIVAPVLFGYTEEARRAKGIDTEVPVSSRKQWNREAFITEAYGKLNESEAQVLENFCSQLEALECDMTWGSIGSKRGTLSVKKPSISEKTLLGVTSDGRLFFEFACHKGDTAERARERLETLIKQRTNVIIPNDSRTYPSYPIQSWRSDANQLFESFRDLLAEFREASSGQEVIMDRM